MSNSFSSGNLVSLLRQVLLVFPAQAQRGMEGDCQHQGRTARSQQHSHPPQVLGPLSSKLHILEDTKQSLWIESQGQESEVHLLGVGELGICSVAERLPSMHGALEHDFQNQNQNKSSALCSWVL